MANKTFLNGVRIKKKPEGQYGPWYNMWIPNVEEFIQHLRNFQTDAKGGLNFTISEQMADKSQMSVALDDYRPNNAAAPAPTTRPPANFTPVANTAKPQQSAPAPTGKKPLPF